MNLKNSKSAYIQIAEYYKKLINAGSLKEGDELPSVREAAVFFGVNPNTVQAAFSLLVNDNYLLNIYKKGFFVKNHKILNEEIINDTLNELFSKGITKEEILKELMKEDNKND